MDLEDPSRFQVFFSNFGWFLLPGKKPRNQEKSEKIREKSEKFLGFLGSPDQVIFRQIFEGQGENDPKKGQ